MSGTAAPQPFSDNSWPEPNPSPPKNSSAHFGKPPKRSKDFRIKDFLSSIDETPDFHDPYSDLSLFLSQKIKQEMRFHGSGKKWSVRIQEDLVKKITPDFQKKFPQQRLGVYALRKLWDKISYYSQQIQQEKEAVTQDGKLNIFFFIKENLKQYLQFKLSSQLPPYYHAHQLAMKMSECLAAVDGVRPKLDELTKMIWSMQRHLLKGLEADQFKSPYDDYDNTDKLIVKTILEITAKEPSLSQQELEYKLQQTFQELHDMPSFASLDAIKLAVSALLAEKLYPSSPFHSLFLAEQKKAMQHFIRRHTALCKSALGLPDLVRRILALYALAKELPKQVDKTELSRAISAIYLEKPEECSSLSQPLYAFISTEAMLLKQKEISIEDATCAIMEAYEEAKSLPVLQTEQQEMLEVIVWKHLSETEALLQKLPYLIGQRIEEGIANSFIDNPCQSFAGVVQTTVSFFQKIKDLNISKAQNKIHLWTMQGDMLCRWIRLDSEAPLLKLILQKWKAGEFEGKTHQECVSEISLEYLKRHPHLASYAPQLSLRISILYKYLWYNLAASIKESSFDRFLKWHAMQLKPFLEQEQLLLQMEEICKKSLPLMPFDLSYVRQSLSQQNNT